jgi:hypothetical protein
MRKSPEELRKISSNVGRANQHCDNGEGVKKKGSIRAVCGHWKGSGDGRARHPQRAAAFFPVRSPRTAVVLEHAIEAISDEMACFQQGDTERDQ